MQVAGAGCRDQWSRQGGVRCRGAAGRDPGRRRLLHERVPGWRRGRPSGEQGPGAPSGEQDMAVSDDADAGPGGVGPGGTIAEPQSLCALVGWRQPAAWVGERMGEGMEAEERGLGQSSFYIYMYRYWAFSVQSGPHGERGWGATYYPRPRDA